MYFKNLVSKLILVASFSFVFLFSAQALSTTVLSSYLNIKDALVKSNSKTTSAAASEMVNILQAKTDDLSKNILVDAKGISESNDVKNAAQTF